MDNRLAILGSAVLSSAITYLLMKRSQDSCPRCESESSVGGAAAAKWLPRLETKDNPPLNPNTLADKLSVEDVDLTDKRVLIRVDYNVPMKDGKITDTRRVDETLDTLRLVLSRKPKAVTLIAHLGQPTAQDRKENFKNFTLEPVAELLSQRLGVPVKFLPDCVGPEVEREINECKPGSVFLCENLRFHMEEIGSEAPAKGQPPVKASAEAKAAFQEALSRLGDVFVFEAFGAAHRPHSSISGIKIPIRVAGLLMKKELEIFSQVLDKPKKPLLAILGGAKISDKIAVIENLLNTADEIIIGGGMAYTFKKLLHGVNIGDSLFDEEGAKYVERIMQKAKERNVKFHFPIDHVITDQKPGKKGEASKDARVGVTDDAQGIPAGWMALDIGPATRFQFSKVIERANTIIWNGPMGVFEMPAFSAGTLSVMCDCVRATKRGATVVIGGGDTGAATDKFYYHHKPISEQVTHVSTGGGSSLVLLEGKLLPGVANLVSRSALANTEAGKQ